MIFNYNTYIYLHNIVFVMICVLKFLLISGIILTACLVPQLFGLTLHEAVCVVSKLAAFQVDLFMRFYELLRVCLRIE